MTEIVVKKKNFMWLGDANTRNVTPTVLRGGYNSTMTPLKTARIDDRFNEEERMFQNESLLNILNP